MKVMVCTCVTFAVVYCAGGCFSRLFPCYQGRYDETGASQSSFKWIEAFAQLSDVPLIVMNFLFLGDLRKVALSCKFFFKQATNDPLLLWRLSIPGAPEYQALYAQEDSAPYAPKLSPVLLETKKVLFNVHRKILFDWLIDVQGEYQLSIETLHTSFQLIDRCLQLKPSLPTSQIQLLGATCLFIASKFCESATHPSLSDMVWVCDTAFTHQEHRNMELQVLQTTSFRVHSSTPFSFIEALSLLLQQPPAVQALACYLADLFMIEAESIGTQPSSIAGACMVVAMHNTVYNNEELASVKRRTSFKEVAFATRTSIPEIRALACKVQSLHLLDHFVNGNGKSDTSILRPPSVRDPPLRAVFERHSALVLPLSEVMPTPAALMQPRRAVVEICDTARTHHCCWCGEEACAEETRRTMHEYIELVPASLSPTVSLAKGRGSLYTPFSY